jgi:hypothetical protein
MKNYEKIAEREFNSISSKEKFSQLPKPLQRRAAENVRYKIEQKQTTQGTK